MRIVAAADADAEAALAASPIVHLLQMLSLLLAQPHAAASRSEIGVLSRFPSSLLR